MNAEEVLALVRGLKELHVREAKVSSDGVHIEVVFDMDAEMKDEDGRVAWTK
jgi:hypothetical protein